jgi:hypothetical protein
VAIPVAELSQVPPAVASARVVEEPIQIAAVPVIPAGVGLTLRDDVEKQPVASV